MLPLSRACGHRCSSTTGLHPADVEKLVAQLDRLVDSGNTVIVVEHDMRVVTASDWVIDIGPGAGEDGGHMVASGTPEEVAASSHSRTAPYLARFLAGNTGTRPYKGVGSAKDMPRAGAHPESSGAP